MNKPAHTDMRSRKWLRDNELVPGFEHPAVFYGDVEGHDRHLRVSCEQHRAWLRDIQRSLWSIYRERHRVTFFHFGVHAKQRANRAARTRTANRFVSKLLDDARNVFAVEAA